MLGDFFTKFAAAITSDHVIFLSAFKRHSSSSTWVGTKVNFNQCDQIGRFITL